MLRESTNRIARQPSARPAQALRQFLDAPLRISDVLHQDPHGIGVGGELRRMRSV